MTSFKLREVFKPQKIEPSEEFDTIIVGGGPAGLGAALYSARYQLKTIIVTKTIGGQAVLAPFIENYLGLPNISGSDLVDKFLKHIMNYNIPIVIDEVVNIRKNDVKWIVETKSERNIQGYVVILATGSERRKLNVPGEEEFIGRGVSYCATCDAPFFKNKTVAVIGGGDAALISALYLAAIASKVYIIHRRGEFRAIKTYIDRVFENPKIETIMNTIVLEIIGKDKVEALRIRNIITGEEKLLKIDGVFVEIGSKPPTELFKKIGIETDENGYAIVKPDHSTNLPGIYVAGDSAGGPYKYRLEQIITAVAEGAIAADSAAKYIMSLKRELGKSKV
ncbi:MAG: FAD-dependent oxidoreductase [Desulfurococcaceae archaeon]